MGGLKAAAQSLTYKEFCATIHSSDGSAMTKGFWRLFPKMSVQDITGKLLPGIPADRQTVFGKEVYRREDFLKLPTDYLREKRAGIYGNFVSGREAPPSGECYTGSARVLQYRMAKHYRMSLLTLTELAADNHPKHSAHYRCICAAEIKCDFRCLAPGYLLLLEGIFMVFLDTYQYPGYIHQWSSNATYDLVKQLRELAGLPHMGWQGLNRAWPIYQGFANPAAKSVAPCAHCKGDARPGLRTLVDAADPLMGGYLCQRCDRWRKGQGKGKTGQLPSPDEIAESNKFVEARKLTQAAKAESLRNGTDIKCGNPACDYRQSESATPFKGQQN